MRLDRAKLVKTEGLGACPPLLDPKFVAADAARCRPDDLVIGIEWSGVAKAYPLSMLWLHGCVNDMVYAKAVLVAYCPFSSAWAVFDPLLARNRRLTFETYGVYQGATVIRDQQTGSLWSPLEGRCLTRPLKDRLLRQIAAIQATWAQWLWLHPDTQVLADDTPFRDRYRPLGLVKARLGSGYRRFPTDWKPGLPPEMLVLGVRSQEGPHAYPLRELPSVANEKLGKQAMVIFSDRQAEHAIAFERETDGQDMTFLEKDGEIRDCETGSLWSRDGRCRRGPLSGHPLTLVPCLTVEWYAWSAYFPQTRLVQHS